MGFKITKKIIILFLFCLITFLPVKAVPDAGEFVRVGITDNKFQNVLKQDVTVFATAESEICDKLTKQRILHIEPNTEIAIKNSYSGLEVKVGEQAATLRDFVIISPSGLLGVKNLKRKGVQALYHGVFEVVQKPDRSGFYLVNLVELQEYLKGVVPNEMPIRFGLEALKAQTVAARNYVLTPRTQAYDEFNVVDSVSSQVYFGVNTEADLATQAVMETDGIVALYDNELILTLYSSTAGGYTESYSYAFSDPETKQFPSVSKPYLVATPDREDIEPLDNEEKAREFYTSKVPSYDIESPYYRWQKEWAVGELENVLKKTLVTQSKTGFINPVFNQGDELGQIKDIKVMKRGASGKAIEIDLMTTKGCYRISKELVIRRVFQKDGISLPSANIVIDKTLDSYGNVTDIKVLGGGFGHGVGMSQFGAGYMATKLEQPYYNILRHYYKGISLGTRPVVVKDEEVKQTFWAPIGRAQIVLTGQIVPKIEVSINGKKEEFTLTKNLFQKEAKIDISKYIEDGANTIVFYPSVCPLKMYVELVEKYETKNTTNIFLDGIED
ncbi:MAG: SpoIID/LytB domain-containing protein [Cyanobacteria bacterium SIG28]|nr:SpoIID/LytB domain-containing protein [Cyanobacteria bacterium SIG28]